MRCFSSSRVNHFCGFPLWELFLFQNRTARLSTTFPGLSRRGDGFSPSGEEATSYCVTQNSNMVLIRHISHVWLRPIALEPRHPQNTFFDFDFFVSFFVFFLKNILYTVIKIQYNWEWLHEWYRSFRMVDFLLFHHYLQCFMLTHLVWVLHAYAPCVSDYYATLFGSDFSSERYLSRL